MGEVNRYVNKNKNKNVIIELIYILQLNSIGNMFDVALRVLFIFINICIYMSCAVCVRM